MADTDTISIDEVAARLDEVESYLNIDSLRSDIRALEEKSAAPGFWDDADTARKVMAELARARDSVSGIDAARRKLELPAPDRVAILAHHGKLPLHGDKAA